MQLTMNRCGFLGFHHKYGLKRLRGGVGQSMLKIREFVEEKIFIFAFKHIILAA